MLQKLWDQFDVVSLERIATSKKGQVAVSLLAFTYMQAGVSFGINVWLINRLGDSIYGILSFGLVAAAICKVVVDFGAERTLVRDLVHARDPKAMMAASAVMRLIAAAALAIGGTTWLALGEPLGEKVWPVVLCASTGVLLGLSPKGWYDSQYKMNIHAGMMLAERILYGVFVFTLIGLFAGLRNALVAATCLIITRAIGFFVQWGCAIKSSCLHFVDLKTNLIWIFRQNVLVFGAMLGNLAAPQINQLILGHQQGVASLAHFFIAFQAIKIVQLSQQAVLRLLLPRIADLTSPGSLPSVAQSRFVRFSVYSLTVAVVLIVPIILLAPILAKWCLPPSFRASVLPLQLLSLSSIPLGVGLIATHFMICLRRNAHYLVTSLSKGVLAIALGQFLIPKYGGVGVALTILICATIVMIIQCGLAWRAIRSMDVPRANGV